MDGVDGIQRVNAVVVSPDNAQVYATGLNDDALVAFDRDASGNLTFNSQMKNGVNGVTGMDGPSRLTISNDGEHMQNNTVQLFENREEGLTQSNTIPGQTRFTDVAFNPNNNNLVTGSADNSAKVWNSATGELIYSLSGHNGEVSAVSYSLDGEAIVTGSQDSIGRLWRTGTGTEPITLSGHNGALNSIIYNDDGTQIATASDDKSTIIWNPENGAILHTLTRHDGKVNAIAFDPSSTYLATASEDRIIRLFDLSTEEIASVFRHDSPVRALTFDPTGERIVAGGDDGLLQVWEVATESNPQTIDIEMPIRDIAYHPNEDVVAVATETAVSLWNLATAELINRISIENGIVNKIAFNHAGTLLATAGNNGAATLWQYPSGELVRTLIGHNGSVNDVTFGTQ